MVVLANDEGVEAMKTEKEIRGYIVDLKMIALTRRNDDNTLIEGAVRALEWVLKGEP